MPYPAFRTVNAEPRGWQAAPYCERPCAGIRSTGTPSLRSGQALPVRMGRIPMLPLPFEL